MYVSLPEMYMYVIVIDLRKTTQLQLVETQDLSILTVHCHLQSVAISTV